MTTTRNKNTSGGLERDTKVITICFHHEKIFSVIFEKNNNKCYDVFHKNDEHKGKANKSKR